MRDEWRRVGAFLKRPTLDNAGSCTASPASSMLARVYTLDIAIMITLIVIAGAVTAVGLELPKTALAEMDITIWIFLAAVVAAPVLEEILFRGWLSGKPGHVFALLSIALGTGIFAVIGENRPLVSYPFLIGGFALALTLLIMLRRKPVMTWFVRGFGLFFWLATAAFALIHLGNFETMSVWLLPLVLPQFVLGALAGYVRVQIGLWGAMALHAMHNATLMGVVLLGTLVGEAPAG